MQGKSCAKQGRAYFTIVYIAPGVREATLYTVQEYVEKRSADVNNGCSRS
jgi:hypothetical protein